MNEYFSLKLKFGNSFQQTSECYVSQNSFGLLVFYKHRIVKQRPSEWISWWSSLWSHYYASSSKNCTQLICKVKKKWVTSDNNEKETVPILQEAASNTIYTS